MPLESSSTRTLIQKSKLTSCNGGQGLDNYLTMCRSRASSPIIKTFKRSKRTEIILIIIRYEELDKRILNKLEIEQKERKDQLKKEVMLLPILLSIQV